jgi:hypothetical protein
MLRAVALTLTCALLALTAAACGESASGGAGDPASLVPASAPVYVEASVRPEGNLREDALAAAGKLLRTDDPAGELREQFDKAIAEGGGGLTWEKDFAPWLGEKAALWATNVEAEEPSFVAIAATTDAEAAAAAIQRFKQQDGSAYEKRSHAGVDYEVNPDGVAAAIVDDFLVYGSEDAFKRTAETADGGDALADADHYQNAIDDLEDDRLALLFGDSKALWETGSEEDPETEAVFDQITRVLAFDKVGPTAGSFHADGNALTVDSLTFDVPEGPLRTLFTLLGGASSELMPELPGDAWGAFAIPKLGEASQQMFADVAGALGGAAAAAQVKEATGLDLQQDVFSWIGDTGVFVRGTSEPELDGALVIQSTDDGRASAAFGKIIGLIGKESGAPPKPIELTGAESAFSIVAPDVPKPIVLARGEGRVVVAYGEDAAKVALDPATKLGDSELYRRAKDTLGNGTEPGLLLSMPSIVALVDAIGEADADWAEFKPYLQSIDAITTGGKLDGDTVESRIAVTLK